MDLYIVYAIESEVDARIYVGFSNDVAKRLKQHNARKTKSTKGFIPWKIIYTEEIMGRLNARDREKYLKSGIGKEFLKQIIS